MLTQKRPRRLDRRPVVDDFAAQNATSGGSSETEVNELTARPTGSSAVHGGDHGDAGGEVAEHLAEPGRVDRVAARRGSARSSGLRSGGARLALRQRSERISARRDVRPSAAAMTSSDSHPRRGRRARRAAGRPRRRRGAGSWWNSASAAGAGLAWPRAPRSRRCSGPSGTSARTRRACTARRGSAGRRRRQSSSTASATVSLPSSGAWWSLM